MTYWLSSVSYERFQADEQYEFAVDGYQESEFNRALRVEPGDRFVYYIKRLELFAALAEARGRCYLDWTRLWPDATYPVRFERRPLVVLPRAQMVPARSLVPRLSLAGDRTG
ncbi:MAG: EVE domain-containing protein [Dehalococcoidia bacterium]